MATGLEIAACDVTSTAQVDPNPVLAVSPWRSECGRHKHLDFAINIYKYLSHPGGTCPSQRTSSSLRAQQKYLGPLAGPEGDHIPLAHTSLHWPPWGAEPQRETFQPHVQVEGLRSSPVAGDAPVAQAAPLIHLTAAALHVRRERFLNSPDTISSFWRWIEDPVGLGSFLVWVFLVDVGFDFSVFWRIWFYLPFLFYLWDARNVNSDLFWHCWRTSGRCKWIYECECLKC